MTTIRNLDYPIEAVRHAIYSFAVAHGGVAIGENFASFGEFSRQVALSVGHYLNAQPVIRTSSDGDVCFGNLVGDDFVDFSTFFPSMKCHNISEYSFSRLECSETGLYYSILDYIDTFFREISQIDMSVRSCNRCGSIDKFVHGSGIHFGKFCPVLFVGESPARNGWRVTGVAWKDVNGKTIPSGAILNKLLSPLNVCVQDIPFIEAIKCFQHDRRMLSSALSNCNTLLERQIKVLRPLIVVPLGEKAAIGVMGRDRIKRLSDIAGTVTVTSLYGYDISIIPAYHPSPISPKGYKDNIAVFDVIASVIRRHSMYMWEKDNVYCRS